MDRSNEQLINLRYPTLSHFKWYKDIFLSKVLKRDDSNGNFWKEKFIHGVPTLFANTICTYFYAKHVGVIPYDLYTYGELTIEISGQGLQLCNDLKLQCQLSKERAQNKRPLGDYCQ